MSRKKVKKSEFKPIRHWSLLFLLVAGFCVLAVQAVRLQWEQGEFLKAQGDARTLRTVTVKPNRGRIRDRNGEILAVSTPVDSIWGDPREFCKSGDSINRLAEALDLAAGDLTRDCAKARQQSFMYLKRHMPPAEAQHVIGLHIDGIYKQREYRRYYPMGPIAAHVVGFTDIDDFGQEGLESRFESILSGSEGLNRIVRDQKGRVVERVHRIQAVRHGNDLDSSLDVRIQHVTRRALAYSVARFKAAGASAIVLDSQSGEVLAMVNLPDYNPNRRRVRNNPAYRNRAVTDLLEPGSTIKPFTIAMALDSGQFDVNSTVETSPGKLRIGGHVIHDVHDYGTLSVSRVIVKSSNIGAAKIALSLSPERLYGVLQGVGFGFASGIELPGERQGYLPKSKKWRPIEHATLSYGYGLSATPIQIAQAYSVLASGGKMVPVTIRKRRQPVRSERVLSERVVNAVSTMLEIVVSKEGTARRAGIAHYRVAGKTGTSHKLIDGKYAEKRYISSFAGFAPVSNPRFVMAVVVDDPRGSEYFGGLVAAPVFAEVIAEAMRLYNIPPDKIGVQQVQRALPVALGEDA